MVPTTVAHAQTFHSAQAIIQGSGSSVDYQQTQANAGLPLSWTDVSDGFTINEGFSNFSYGGEASGTFNGRSFDGLISSFATMVSSEFSGAGATNQSEGRLTTDRIDFDYNGLTSATIAFGSVFSESFSQSGNPATFNNFAEARLDVTRWVPAGQGFNSVETKTILYSEQVTHVGEEPLSQMRDPISFELGAGDILTINTTFRLTAGSGVEFNVVSSATIETSLFADFFITSMTPGLEIETVRSGIDWEAAPVPEPATYAAFAGLAVFCLVVWRRRTA